MKLSIPNRLESKSPTPDNLKTYTFGNTGNAQYGNIFAPIASQLGYYTSEGYDPSISNLIDDYVESNGLPDSDARYLKAFGNGTNDNFNAAVQFLKDRNQRRETIENSTGLNLFLTDPAVHFSIALPSIGVRGAMHLGRGLSRIQSAKPVAKQLDRRARNMFGDNLSDIATFAPDELFRLKGMSANRITSDLAAMQRPVSMAVSSQALLSGKRYTASQLARIAALDAAVVDGSINLTTALNEISYGENPAENILNAAIYTAATTAFGGALGYGLGFAMNQPLRQVQRAKQFGQEYKKYLSERSKKPDERGDVGYAAPWFTESIMYRVMPSPLKETLADKQIPDRFKKMMLRLGADHGIALRENEAGIPSEPSVFINSGRRMGDWYRAVNAIDESFSRVNPTGATEFMNVPVGSYYHGLLQKLGKNVMTRGDWYDHIGDLIIREVPYEKMSPEEIASVKAYREFDQVFGEQLTDLGLIGGKQAWTEEYIRKAGRMGRMVSVVDSMARRNKEYLEGRIASRQKKIDKNIALRDKLLTEQSNRGLTAKQQSLLAKVDREIEDFNSAIGNIKDLIARLDGATADDVLAMRDDLNLTPKMRAALDDIADDLDEMRKEIEVVQDMLDRQVGGPKAPNHFYRIWNKQAVNDDREGLEAILAAHYKENNVIYRRNNKGRFERIELDTSDEAVKKRAAKTVDNILEEIDSDDVDAMFSGYGRAGPMVSRNLNIPNELVADYMVKNVREVMLAYTQRVAPKIEFHKQFPNPKNPAKPMTLEDRIDMMRSEMVDEGVPEKAIDRFIKNFVASYDIIVGSNVKRPDAIDSKIANVLRTATTWTFLGGSGIAALGDTASLLMDHEMRVIGKAFVASLNDPSILPRAKRELNIGGEALEIAAGMVHLRQLESQSRDMFNAGTTAKLNEGFFVANLLGPVTVATKVMDGLLRGHTIIEASQKLVSGKASSFEKTFLARYGISEDMAKRFTQMPFEQTNNKLILANTEAWDDVEAVEVFRNALRAGVANRIIMGTPADKPLVMSGATYIPDSVASKLPFELPVDPRVKGYRRLESGLLTLPFTFYTYTVGALSKITANHASGTVRNRLAHIAVAMTLGGMIVKFRTPSWAWDEMDVEDKAARAFDFSGLAALYSDMAYRSIAMANELGFEGGFPIQPKFKADPDPVGALISLGGAPADWGYEVAKAAADLAAGNYQDGAKGLIRMTPLINALATGGVIKDAANDLAGTLPNAP